MLAPYFNFHDNQQQTHDPIDETDGSFIDHDARDASLRRKLFNCASDSEEPEDREDSLDRLDLRCLSPPPVSPELGQASAQILKRSRCFQLDPASWRSIRAIFRSVRWRERHPRKPATTESRSGRCRPFRSDRSRRRR
ncbi:hypothetical protein quinque_007247 [Culex quinquefasciatus]